MNSIKFLPWIITFAFLLGFYSCKESNEISPDIKNGGIVITFDDDNVSEWFLADAQLSDYKWKATFCVSYFDRLTVEEIQQLHELTNAGHEIAGHSLNHLNAVAYISSEGGDEYLNAEIIPMIELMGNEGFDIKSFAYPFGLRNQESDSILLNYFDIIRGVDRGFYNDVSEHNCFFEYSPVVYGFSIDRHNSFFEGKNYEQYLIDLLTFARDRDKILIVYSHIPVENITGDHQTSISTLNRICDFIEENNMQFYTMSDLEKKLN